MNLYIDIENLESLIKGNKHTLYNDCIKAIQKQLSVFFNFSKKELKSNELLLSWFQLMTEGAGEKNSFNYLDEHKFPKRPLCKGCYLNFSDNQFSSIFLINDEHIDSVRNDGALLIGSPGEEFEIFNKLFLLQNDYTFFKEFKIGSSLFSRWEDVSKYSLPVTDIIFVDPYILIDNSLIESNFIKYLTVLSSNSKCSINVIIYVNKNKVSIGFDKLQKKVVDAIKTVTNCTPSFTMIQYNDQREVASLAEHDRTIFTNYVRIKSGDTYNYFNSSGAVITKGREVTYISLCKNESYLHAKELIRDLQDNINKLKSNSNSIVGDKKSNYLKFS